MVYHGPVKGALPFFASLGFVCPARKDPGSFLQEVTTAKGEPADHRYVSDSFRTLARGKLMVKFLARRHSGTARRSRLAAVALAKTVKAVVFACCEPEPRSVWKATRHLFCCDLNADLSSAADKLSSSHLTPRVMSCRPDDVRN